MSFQRGSHFSGHYFHYCARKRKWLKRLSSWSQESFAWEAEGLDRQETWEQSSEECLSLLANFLQKSMLSWVRSAFLSFWRITVSEDHVHSNARHCHPRSYLQESQQRAFQDKAILLSFKGTNETWRSLTWEETLCRVPNQGRAAEVVNISFPRYDKSISSM